MIENWRFKKGHIPWNKGRSKLNDKRLMVISKKVSERLKGRKLSKTHKKNIGRGHKGKKLSKETKRKISESEKGKIVSEETRKKIRKVRKNQIITEEHKRNIGLALKGRVSPMKGKTSPMKNRKHNAETIRKIKIARKRQREPMKGKHHSEETKRKISKARKGKTFEEFYGKDKAKNIRSKIKEKRKLQISPTKDTSIEVKLQNFLKQLGIEFFTHQYMKIEHGYQCDILIPSMNLVIECDGDYWHKYPIGNDIDHIRTNELINKGFKVLRLWECEINEMSIDKFQDRLEVYK